MQGYAAVYPQDVLRHHRTWIGKRRLTRPSGEHRRPTPRSRESSKATSSSARSSSAVAAAPTAPTATSNTPVFDGLLKPDPDQAERLGEVEGLKVSLTGAHEKLEQMEGDTADDAPFSSALRPSTTTDMSGCQTLDRVVEVNPRDYSRNTSLTARPHVGKPGRAFR